MIKQKTFDKKKKSMSSLDVDVPQIVSKYTARGLIDRILAKLPERGARFSGDEYNIALYIQRSKNENVVCYRGTYAEGTTDNILDPKVPIDAYWLDIDPEYVKDSRSKGKMDDRCELNFVDRTMAYGHSPSEPKEGGEGVVYFDISFVALSSRKMSLLSLPSGNQGAPRTPILLCTIGGDVSVATRIYVKSTEPKHFWNLPSVEYVELFGTSVETGEPTYEKITNS